jgi:hypothetical protein
VKIYKENDFLNTTQNTFYDLRPKVNDILTELEIGLHVHSWHASEDSPPNSESDSDEGGGSDTTSESEDGSDNDKNNKLPNGILFVRIHNSRLQNGHIQIRTQ